MRINRNAVIQREASKATALMFKDRQAKDSARISRNSFTASVCVRAYASETRGTTGCEGRNIICHMKEGEGEGGGREVSER